MRIALSGADIDQSDIDAVVAVLQSGRLSLGPKLGEFEQACADYVGRKHAVAVNSGTSALFLGLQALGIGPGDTVVTTPFSFIATTNAVLMVGAEPKLIDIDPVSYNLDLDQLDEALAAEPRAIMPVEVFGNPAGLDEAYDRARARGVLCVEDSCEALGSRVNGRAAGTLGDISAFAFYPNKQITTGEGGVILTDRDDVAALCASLRNQGRDAGAGWLAHARLGYNFRLSDINCALGITQLRRIEMFVGKRAQVARWYQQRLGDDDRLVVPREPAGCRMSWFVFVVRLADGYDADDRQAVLQRLHDQGIQCSNYFTPIHLQPFMVERFGYRPGDFPVTEKVAERTIALPFCNQVSEAEVDEVCRALRAALDERPRP